MKNELINVTKLSHKKCRSPIQCQLAYATRDNFLGRIVKGYHANAAHVCLMTPKAAEALCNVQNVLHQTNLGLFVFDSFRPLRAVKDFNQWMHDPTKTSYELERKKIHYPHLEKSQLAQLGYVCDDVSNHCFGDTVDLSLIDLQNNRLLEMGSCFDYFDPLSHLSASAKSIGQQAYNNRQLLLKVMQDAGFLPYEKEYWHFTFHQREIEIPLDFEITKQLA